MGCMWSIPLSDNDSSSVGAHVPEKLDLSNNEGATIQDDLWRQTLEDKLIEGQKRNIPLRQHLSPETTFDSSLRMLTELYTRHGFTSRVPQVTTILNSIQPFTAAITTMVQAQPEISGLAWGIIQMVLQSLVRYTSNFDDIRRMLQEFSTVLPRFHAYMNVMHTPRLHEALRGFYEVYIDFCFAVLLFLNLGQCCGFIQAQSGVVGRNFTNTMKELKVKKAQFEAEARLADVQVHARRHEELLSKLPDASLGDPVTTGLVGQSVMFTGRDNVLSQLHSIFAPSFDKTQPGKQTRRSCVIHGLGGMGKSETALEYTYRYRSCYTHIFWLHAQSDATLTDSFITIIKKLGLDREEVTLERKIESCLEWFESPANRWLLVFDNAEVASVVQRFWPPGIYGAILMTSQDPDFVNMTQSEIHLQGMSIEEGCSLVQQYLRRGASEKTAAEELSANLGGLPLAIAHFSGYVSLSQCTIDQILGSIRTQFKSSQIWTSSTGVSSSRYSHTLNTVWDLAWQRLSYDARKILKILAFLNPDSVPEDLFLGSARDSAVENSETWGINRFNEAVKNLRQRHLVERDVHNDECQLRVHRALQINILHKLNAQTDERQLIFEEGLNLVRRAFPLQDIAKRGDSSQWPTSKKYLPQVLSLSTAYTQMEPKLIAGMSLATLLRDAGWFLFNLGCSPDGVRILEQGEEVCDELINSGHLEAQIILADILGPSQVYCQFMGVSGRRSALQKATKQLKIRKELTENKQSQQWTENDKIGLARALVDLGMTYAQLNDMEEADRLWQEAEAAYHQIGTDDALAARLGSLCSFRAWFLAIRQQKVEAIVLARGGCTLVENALGAESHLTLQTKFCTALVAFTIGDFTEALRLHEEVFEHRRCIHGNNHQETLASRYNVAVAHQAMGNIEKAEYYLRETLKHSVLTIQWREEDVARTKFRLSIVLSEQKRPSEAVRFKMEALELCERSVHLLPELDTSHRTVEDDMTAFDAGVTVWHGRTTGMWGNGRPY